MEQLQNEILPEQAYFLPDESSSDLNEVIEEIEPVKLNQDQNTPKLSLLNYNLVLYFSEFLLINDLLRIVKLNKKLRTILIKKSLTLIKYMQIKDLYKNDDIINVHDLLSANRTNSHIILEEIHRKLCEIIIPSLADHIIGHYISSKTSMSIYFENINDQQLKILNFISLSEIRRCKYNLTFGNFPLEKLPILIKILKQANNLRDLTFESLNMNKIFLLDLFSTIGSKSIKSLTIRTSNSRFDRSEDILLSNLSSLLTNIVNSKSLVKVTIPFLVQEFIDKLPKYNKTINYLQIRDSKDTVSLKFDALFVNSTIETLHFFNCSISSPSFTNLCVSLAKPLINSKIHTLIFDSTGISDFNILAFVLNTNPQILKLEIRENNILLSKIQILLESLVNNTTLKTLVLFGIDKEGFNLLLTVLNTNNHLETVDLTLNNIRFNSNEEFADIGKYLENNTSLKTIVIKEPKVLADKISEVFTLKEVERIKQLI